MTIEQSYSEGGPSICKDGKCPSIHVTSEGTVLIQGKTIDLSSIENIDTSSGEDVVAIDADAFRKILGYYMQDM
jgi:hypothetical protein